MGMLVSLEKQCLRRDVLEVYRVTHAMQRVGGERFSISFVVLEPAIIQGLD